MSEQEWISTLAKLIEEQAVGAHSATTEKIKVESGMELASGFQVSDYTGKGARHKVLFHNADIVVTEHGPKDHWRPRVAMECKLGELTSKEALAYNARAEQFKAVQPYLRYGLLIGGYDGLSLPVRVLKHCAQFDFIVAWEGSLPKGMTRDRLGAIIIAEIDASRVLSGMLLKEGTAAMGPIRMIHRPLTLA